jgi:cell shape-determining protein MreC
MIQSLSDRNRKKSLQNKRVILIGASLLLLSFWFFLKPLFLTFFDPILSAYVGVRSSALTSFEKTRTFFITKEKSLTYIKELEEENSRLHNALARFQYDPCLNQFEERGNNILGKVATTSLALSSSSEKEGASVNDKAFLDPCIHREKMRAKEEVVLKVSPLVSPLSSLYDTVRINKGEGAGVQIGDAVYTRGRIVIGKVVSLTRNTALVRLYAKDGAETYGTLSDSGASFKVVGNGAGSYKAKISKDIEVDEGDIVLLTESQELALGTVASVSFEKEDVAKTLYIKGGFNVSRLGALYVTLQ